MFRALPLKPAYFKVDIAAGGKDEIEHQRYWEGDILYTQS